MTEPKKSGPGKLKKLFKFSGKIPVEQFLELTRLRASALYERQVSQVDRGTFRWSTKSIALIDLAPLECGDLYREVVIVDLPLEAAIRWSSHSSDLLPHVEPVERPEPKTRSAPRVKKPKPCSGCGRLEAPKPKESVRNIACFTCGYPLRVLNPGDTHQ